MLKKLFFVALLFAVAGPAMAQVSAVTEININVPSIIVLYYRPSVQFDVTTSLPSVLGMTAAESVVLEPGAVVLTDFTGGDATVDGSPEGFTDPGSLTAEVGGFWAVRSIGPNDTRVTVALDEANITNGTSTITMSNVRTGVGGAFAGTSVDFTPPGLGFGNIVVGDVQFVVDLSGMTTSGLHTGGRIEITAENL